MYLYVHVIWNMGMIMLKGVFFLQNMDEDSTTKYLGHLKAVFEDRASSEAAVTSGKSISKYSH